MEPAAQWMEPLFLGPTRLGHSTSTTSMPMDSNHLVAAGSPVGTRIFMGSRTTPVSAHARVELITWCLRAREVFIGLE